MLPIETYKEVLKEFNLTDKEIELIRDSLYGMVNKMLDDLYERKTKNN